MALHATTEAGKYRSWFCGERRVGSFFLVHAVYHTKYVAVKYNENLVIGIVKINTASSRTSWQQGGVQVTCSLLKIEEI